MGSVNYTASIKQVRYKFKKPFITEATKISKREEKNNKRRAANLSGRPMPHSEIVKYLIQNARARVGEVHKKSTNIL